MYNLFLFYKNYFTDEFGMSVTILSGQSFQKRAIDDESRH